MKEKKLDKKLVEKILKDAEEALATPKKEIFYRCYYCKTKVVTNDSLCQSCQVKLKKPFKETI